MGLFVGQIRKHELLQEKAKLEWLMLNITQAKAVATKSAMNLMQVGTDLDSESPIIKNMKARRDKMEQIEKELDRKMTMYQNKLKAVETEIQSV